MTGRFWDETRPGGHPCHRIAPHDIPDVPPDWLVWSERLAAAGDRPPRWMRPQGRRPAEDAARLLKAVLLVLAVVLLLAGLLVLR